MLRGFQLLRRSSHLHFQRVRKSSFPLLGEGKVEGGKSDCGAEIAGEKVGRRRMRMNGPTCNKLCCILDSCRVQSKGVPNQP